LHRSRNHHSTDLSLTNQLLLCANPASHTSRLLCVRQVRRLQHCAQFTHTRRPVEPPWLLCVHLASSPCGFTRAVLQCGGISHSPHTLHTSRVPQRVLFSSRPHRDVAESVHAKLKANVRVVPLVGAKPASEWQWSRRANACTSCRCRATSALFHVTIKLTLLFFLHCALRRVRERGGHLSGSRTTADQGVSV
jgi:hypothetical protein